MRHPIQGHERAPVSWMRLLPVLPLALLAAACDEGATTAKPAPDPKVEVAEATQAKIPLTKEFVGTTAAVKLVEVRAKVQGYLHERPFTEGADVKAGDVLFVIDQRPFQAEVDRITAELEQNKAQLTFAQQQLERYKKLSDDSFASVQKFESVQSDALTAQGEVAASQAELRSAELDLEYSSITAPIDGRISNTLVNVGNLISEADTLMTTLVQLDPIYIYFSPSEAAYQEMAPYLTKSPLKVSLGLATGVNHPYEGRIDFVDNHVDAATGTIKMRAVIPNPDKTQRPGQYVDVTVLLTDDHDAVLVPAPAVAEDEAGHYLFVVDKDNKAERRSVRVGALYKDRYIVNDGVKPGDRVIVKGIQKVHGGKPVDVVTPDAPAAKSSDQAANSG